MFEKIDSEHRERAVSGRFVPRRSFVRRFLLVSVTAVFLVILLAPQSGQPQGSDTEAPSFEMFVQMGKAVIWMGDEIRYTVFEPSTVEARLSGQTGELLLILPLGEQQPGQYTLPWDGTVDGAPFAGRYEFELFFGHEYAARFWFLCRPIYLES